MTILTEIVLVIRIPTLKIFIVEMAGRMMINIKENKQEERSRSRDSEKGNESDDEGLPRKHQRPRRKNRAVHSLDNSSLQIDSYDPYQTPAEMLE